MKYLTDEEHALWLEAAIDPIHFIDEYCNAVNVLKNNKITSIKCFEYQKRVLEEYLSHRMNVILKSRQCLPAGTAVNTPDGIKMIEDFKSGDQVYSWNLEEDKKEIDQVYDAWNSGERNCVTFNLRDTRDFTVGENHPFYVEGKGFIKAKDLKKGDEIKISDSSFGNITPSNSYAIALGFMIADGCVTNQSKSLNINSFCLQEHQEKVFNLCSAFDFKKSIKNIGFDVFSHQSHIKNTCNPFIENCDQVATLESDGHHNIFPNEIFMWSRESVSLLLNIIFTESGWVSIHKKGKRRRLEIGILASSQLLLQQTKELLNRFGIRSNIYQDKEAKNKKKRLWKLQITHSKACKKFIEEIGDCGKLTQEHLDVINNCNYDSKYDAVVNSVVSAGKQMCYDISVDKNENFFVDGLLTHNTGLSVITACYVAWKMIFGVDEYVVIVANNQNAAKRFLKHVKQVLMMLPEFLYSKERDEDVFSALEIKLKNGNYCIAQAAGKNAVRGDTPTLLILDEWAFVKDDEDIWTAASFAMSQSEGDCIVISTPNGTSNLYHKFWVEAERGDGAFNAIRVHWTENPKASEGLEWRENDDGIKIPWSPWYEERCKEANYDTVRIAQELDLSFAGSKLLALDQAEIERQHRRIEAENVQPIMYYEFDDPRRPFVTNETLCRVWEMPQKGAQYIIACDVAYKGIDYSTIQVLNAKTHNQAAEYQGKVDPDIFAHMIAKIGRSYNNAFVVVEANNHGLVTGLELRNRIKYPNLYEGKSSHPKDIYVRHIDYVVHNGDGIPGFMTTSTSRPSVINSIRVFMRETDLRINSRRLLSEMDTFIRNDKGRAEADRGYHDDLVMAYGIALYILETEYHNQYISRARSKAMLEAINFNSNSFEGLPETPEETSRRLKSEAEMKENDYIPPGAGGLWLDKENEDEDDPNDISWLLG